MDIISMLKKDHKIVSGLFDSIGQTGKKAFKTKAKIFDQIYNELTLHTEIEETIFYPVIEQYTETRDITLESYEEHRLVKQLLSELKDISNNEDTWQAKLTVLKELVQHHVKEEEKDLFPKIKKILGTEKLEQMGKEMLQIKAANEATGLIN